MNNLDKQTANEVTRIFDFEGTEVRTVMKDGDIWFVAKDICDVFGETNRNRAMQSLDEDEKGYTQMTTPGGKQQVSIVNEPGLYSLLFSMQPSKARGVSNEHILERQQKLKNFKRWVTHEVIPAIRKHGGYLTEQKIEEALLNPDVLIQLATTLKEEREKRKQAELEAAKKEMVIQEQAPKVDSFHKFLDANGFMDMNEFAKMIGIGRNKLFAHLRELGILMNNNLPYQRYTKYFKIVSTVKGSFTFRKTLINHKGCHYIKERLVKENII